MEKGKQMRFTDEELNLIKSTFKGNEKLLKLMRKVFLPELDPNAPLGQMIDLFMTINPAQMAPETAWIHLQARNVLIGHIDMQLMQLNILAGMDTEEVQLEKAKKNSSK